MGRPWAGFTSPPLPGLLHLHGHGLTLCTLRPPALQGQGQQTPSLVALWEQEDLHINAC